MATLQSVTQDVAWIKSDFISITGATLLKQF